MIDLKNSLQVAQTLAPVARTSSQNGTGIDTANFGGCVAIAECGALTDGTHTPTLQDSADNSSWADVAAGQMIGSFAAATANGVQMVGYAGTKRYVRVRMVVSSATTGAVTSAVIVGGALRKAP